MRYWIALIISFWCTSVFSASLTIKLPDNSTITVDREDLLKEFDTQAFSTHLPWFANSYRFAGIPVTELIKRYGNNETYAITFAALNDYQATISVNDIKKYSPIMALTMNGKEMRVRHKGPYWMIFNLDQFPEIDNADYHAKMVWQIDELIIHSRTHEHQN